MILLWVLLALLAIGAIFMGVLVWRDTRHLNIPDQEVPRLILIGIADPWRYWYCERPRRFAAKERAIWLHALAERLGLSTVQGAHCPLCGSEIPNAWRADPRGRLAVVPGPVHCSACDFRLDACRHCRYFQPAGGQRTDALSGMGVSWTHGRCTFYKSIQPVEAITSPDMARRLQERGYTHLRAPTPITDSYIPLETCTAFALEARQLPHSGMRKPGRRQQFALRVLAQATPAQIEPPGQEPGEKEQWLL
jgi:hypothetical protein